MIAKVSRRPAAGGFTLIELVSVIIIVGVLAAIAVPRYIALGRDARVAAVNTMASTLRSTAENVRVMCKLNAACDYSASIQVLSIGGQYADLNYGWLDSGDMLGNTQIDTWINYAGFTASLPAGNITLFTLDVAPNPSNCSVSYYDAYSRGPSLGILITVATSGC